MRCSRRHQVDRCVACSALNPKLCVPIITVNFNQKSRKTNTNCRNDCIGEMIAFTYSLEIRHDPSEVMPSLPPVGTPRFGRRLFMGRLRLRVRNAATFAPLPAVKTALARGIARSLEVGKL